MGEALFGAFPDLVSQADEILGYSIEQLCLEDPDSRINLTQFTQPALYTVEALEYEQRKDSGETPDAVAGHSLGEYAALFAAGAFDFTTGLELVKKRGELMGEAKGGGMAAVIGLTGDAVKEALAGTGIDTIDVANFNAPGQVIISGPTDDLGSIGDAFKEAGARRVIPLKVSAAFHSRYMADAQARFEEFLATIEFAEPKIPVIANVTALPYEPGSIRDNLTRQITSSVRWQESIEHILDNFDTSVFQELGPGGVLTKMISQIEGARS